METTVNKINSCLREIIVTATEEDVKPVRSKTIENYSKHVNIPGFRKGKAPIQMILKLYGKDIEQDFEEEVINELSKKVVTEEKITPISQAKVINKEYKKGESFYFKVQFEISPEFELTQYKDLEIEKTSFKFSEDDVETEIKRIIEANKQLIDDVKVVNDNYIVTVDVQETDEEGLPVIGSKSDNVPVPLNDSSVDEDIRKKLLNSAVGDQVKVQLTQKQNKADKLLRANLTVKKIQKVILPELDDTLVKKITKDKLSTVEELRNEIRSNIQKQYSVLSENFLRNNIESELIRKNNFEVPEVMVENYLDEMVNDLKDNQPNKTLPSDFDMKAYREKNRALAILKIKTFFLRSKITEKENIKVDDVDLSLHAESESAKTGISTERLLKYYKTSDEVKDRILQKKLDTFLIENNKIVEKEFDPKSEKNPIITE